MLVITNKFIIVVLGKRKSREKTGCRPTTIKTLQTTIGVSVVMANYGETSVGDSSVIASMVVDDDSDGTAMSTSECMHRQE